MERIVIGKTGLEVNRLGIGGIPIQRVDEETAVGVVLHAVEKGFCSGTIKISQVESSSTEQEICLFIN